MKQLKAAGDAAVPHQRTDRFVLLVGDAFFHHAHRELDEIVSGVSQMAQHPSETRDPFSMARC